MSSMQNASPSIVQVAAQVQKVPAVFALKKPIYRNANSSQEDFFLLPYNNIPNILILFCFELCFGTFKKDKKEGLVHSNKQSY